MPRNASLNPGGTPLVSRGYPPATVFFERSGRNPRHGSPLPPPRGAAAPDHGPGAALVTEAAEDLVVPALVLAELDYWCARRLTLDAWLVFLGDVRAGAHPDGPPATPGPR